MPESWIVARLRAAGCVFAEDEAVLLAEAAGEVAADEAPADHVAELERLIARRVAGEPLEYVLGWAQFRGLRVVVEPGVFVPRRRSELLVEQACALAPAGGTVVDLCCGSGALGAAVAAERPDLTVHAVDIDPAAVQCARHALTRVHRGDLFSALPADLRGGIDVVLANVPYVPSGAIATMPPEARDHEPAVALDGGDDGLAVLRRVARFAPDWLAEGGHLLSETSEGQVAAAVAVFRHAGFAARVETCAELAATAVVGRRGPRG